MIRRLLLVLAAAAALVCALTLPAVASGRTTTVALKPNGSTGISGTARITGRTVRATAKGLNPAKRYISLYYGDESTASTGQTFTCADARTAANPRGWGIAPEWTVNADGTGTLRATAPRDLTGVYTMSIREVPAAAGPDPYVGFNPALYPVRACGSVQADRGGLVSSPNLLPDVSGPANGLTSIVQNPGQVGVNPG